MALEFTVGHDRKCGCEACYEARTAEIAKLAAENIRDIWSELSWAAGQEGWALEWMDWFYEELADPERSVGWWSSQATHKMMGFWYMRFEKWKSRRII